MATRTVKVSNVSLGATEHDIYEFFSFSGEIDHVELQGDNERSQVAYVTFKDAKGAETAIFLSGATLVDQSVTIELASGYTLPAAASVQTNVETDTNSPGNESVIHKAEDIVTTMLAKGFVLGKDALNKAKAFDEKHQFTSTATSTVASLDQKIRLSDKISAGGTLVKGVDAKSAIAAAEQTVAYAGSALMKNRYVLTGASWVTGALSRVAKAAGDVGEKTKEKVRVEEEHGLMAQGYTQIYESDSPNMSEKISKTSV